jgi:hypothetical protein
MFAYAEVLEHPRCHRLVPMARERVSIDDDATGAYI